MALQCLEIARAALGEPAKQAGRELLFRCPRHEDEHPSLSVNSAKDCWLCGPCGKGGNAWELAAFLARVEPNDKARITPWLREHGLLNGTSEGMKPVAEYVYRSGSGEPLFKTVRYETDRGKTFRQFRADSKSGWLPALEGVRLVPYRLNEWRDLDWVCIVEGEKCADALWDIGIPATCNPMGAGKWLAEYNAHFAGKKAVVLPDNDKPGESHSRDVARNLLSVAKAVKMVRLPNLPGKGDVVDWIAAGGTREQFLELVKAAPVLTAADIAAWGSKEKAREGFNLVPIRQLLSEPEETVAWLLSDRLPAGGFSMLAGKPKAGKSTLARCLALAVAQGKPFMGWQTDQGPVIYLALEEKRSEVRNHFKAMGASGEAIFIHAAQAPQDAILALREIVKEHKPKLIIVDPLLKLARLRSEKDYAEVSAALEPLLALARESGAHLLAVYHSPKVKRADLIDSPLGSTAFAAAVDTLLVLNRSDKYRTLATVQRYGTDLPETLLDFDSDAKTLSLGADKAEAEQERIAGTIIDYLGGCQEAQTEPEISEGVEGKTVYKRAALRSLFGAGKLIRSGKGVSGDPFRYNVSFSCSPPIAGTREQDMKREAYSAENTPQSLVPDTPDDPGENLDTGEQDFLPSENPEWGEV